VSRASRNSVQSTPQSSRRDVQISSSTDGPSAVPLDPEQDGAGDVIGSDAAAAQVALDAAFAEKAVIDSPDSCGAIGSCKTGKETQRKVRGSGGPRGIHRGWWAPKAGDRITAGLFGATFPQDSFTVDASTRGRASVDDDSAAESKAGAEGSVVRSSVVRMDDSTKRASAARKEVSCVGARNSLVAIAAASVRQASCVLSGKQLPKAGRCGLAVSVLRKKSTSAAVRSFAAQSPDASTAPPFVTRGKSPLLRSNSGLSEALHSMEEAWGADMLSSNFSDELSIATRLRSLPVLRQQPLTLVVQTKSTTASCRLDLGALPPILGKGTEMAFELPLVRNGLVVGVATGVLTVAPEPPMSSTNFDEDATSARDIEADDAHLQYSRTNAYL